jgi:hypothetical protein
MIRDAKIFPITVVLAAALCNAATAAAQPLVVTGTDDPNLDVPAVQAAVDHGGQVVLMGHFSFDRPSIKPDAATYSRMVTVSKEVAISGNRDEHGEMPTITGGAIPFYVDAPGKRIAIRGLRFIRPRGAAIWIYAVNGLVIADCRIEGVEASAEFARYARQLDALATAIFIGSNPAPPKAGQEEHPENNSGPLSIFDNDIDVGGTAGDQTLGICVFGVGEFPGKKVDLYISGNKIRNITERAINLNQIGGRAQIERNVITTGAISHPSNGVQPDVIHAVASGSYLIAHNSIVSEWAAGAGIRVQGNAGAAEEGAIVVDNDVTMSASGNTVFGGNSAGIEIRGLAQGNVVLNNRIRGRAGNALAVIAQGLSVPANNTFVSNDLDGFHPTLAQVFVDAGVTNTLVVGRKGTVRDQGVGTVIVNPGTTAPAGRQKAKNQWQREVGKNEDDQEFDSVCLGGWNRLGAG